MGQTSTVMGPSTRARPEVGPCRCHLYFPYRALMYLRSEDAESSYADVLVVDDDDDVRSSMAEIIRTAGYSVREAENGAVALDVLSGTTVGMVLLDVQMPKIDGLRFLELAGDLPPVIIVSARYRDAVTTPEGSEVFMFLHKPVPPPELLGAVKLALLNR